MDLFFLNKFKSIRFEKEIFECVDVSEKEKRGEMALDVR